MPQFIVIQTDMLNGDNMGDNLKIRMLKTDLADVLNKSFLPIEVKRLIVEDLNRELLQLANDVVEKERQALLNEQSNEKESESNGISSDN